MNHLITLVDIPPGPPFERFPDPRDPHAVRHDALTVGGVGIVISIALLSAALVMRRRRHPKAREALFLSGGLVLAFFVGCLVTATVRPPLRPEPYDGTSCDIVLEGKDTYIGVGQYRRSEISIPVGKTVAISVDNTTKSACALRIPSWNVDLIVDGGSYSWVYVRVDEPSFARLYIEGEGCDIAAHRRAVAMLPGEYAEWQTEPFEEKIIRDDKNRGERDWNLLCMPCHADKDGEKTVGPPLMGMYGSVVELDDGSVSLVDEEFVNWILNAPATRPHPVGYPASMPSFAGQVRYAQVRRLAGFLRTQSSRIPYREIPLKSWGR